MSKTTNGSAPANGAKSEQPPKGIADFYAYLEKETKKSQAELSSIKRKLDKASEERAVVAGNLSTGLKVVEAKVDLIDTKIDASRQDHQDLRRELRYRLSISPTTILISILLGVLGFFIGFFVASAMPMNLRILIGILIALVAFAFSVFVASIRRALNPGEERTRADARQAEPEEQPTEEEKGEEDKSEESDEPESQATEPEKSDKAKPATTKPISTTTKKKE